VARMPAHQQRPLLDASSDQGASSEHVEDVVANRDSVRTVQQVAREPVEVGPSARIESDNLTVGL
jgi:hypothetical protein